MCIYRVEEFEVECPYVGPIQRVHVEHDNTGAGPGWFLHQVTVEDIDKGHMYEFPCDRWLAKDEDDGAIERDLTCTNPPGMSWPEMFLSLFI